jgi:hypothetical protein
MPRFGYFARENTDSDGHMGCGLAAARGSSGLLLRIVVSMAADLMPVYTAPVQGTVKVLSARLRVKCGDARLVY